MLALARRVGPLQASFATSFRRAADVASGSTTRTRSFQSLAPLAEHTTSQAIGVGAKSTHSHGVSVETDLKFRRFGHQRAIWSQALTLYAEQKPPGEGDLGPYPQIEFGAEERRSTPKLRDGSQGSMSESGVAALSYADALWEHISGLGKVPLQAAAIGGDGGQFEIGNGGPRSSSFAEELWEHISSLGRERPLAADSIGEFGRPLYRKTRRKSRGGLYPERVTPTLQIFLSDGQQLSSGSGGHTFHYSGDGGSDGGSSGALVVTGHPKPESMKKVLVVPMPGRPLLPGQLLSIRLRNKKLLEAIRQQQEQGIHYVGAFLRRDSGSPLASSEEWKDTDGLPELHDYGTLAQIHAVYPTTEHTIMLLLGHRRLKITGPVEGERLSAHVEHLQDGPYDRKDDVLKATAQEVVQTMRDLMNLNPLYKEAAALFFQQSIARRGGPRRSGLSRLEWLTLLSQLSPTQGRLTKILRQRRRAAAAGDLGRGFEGHGDMSNPSMLADFAASQTSADADKLQAVLERLEVPERLNMVLLLLKKELELSKLQADIGKKVEEKISGDQRRYFLMEQLKSIKKELGLEKDDKTALISKFEEKLEPFRASCPPAVLQVIQEETEKLQGLEPSSSEFNVTRNYLDWLTSVPWGHHSKENFDVRQAQQILDQDHYGLTDVKERILEFIAVGKLRGSSQGKIICLSGPPGTGKTSIGRSIANALNRKFYRFSVGGLSDVAEIKGHRRTYVGAMPGKMVQCLKTVQTANPLVLIDEIDKLGRGYQGDPASALLELLDPEQNSNFLDHYLDVPVDLSKVLFMCTANVVEDIPAPLRDRMEVIRLVGYIADEKMHIARDYLEPTAQKNSGVKPTEAEIAEDALLELIETYCREAGVRNLQKQIDKVYRKIALRIVRQRLAADAARHESAEAFKRSYAKRLWDFISSKPQTSQPRAPGTGTASASEHEKLASLEIEKGTEDKMVEDAVKDEEGALSGEKVVVTKDNLSDFVGNPVFTSEKLYDETPVGVVMGLAWTSMGGSTLYVETSVIESGENKGGITVTGQLGDVMKESTSIALTVARGLLRQAQPDSNFFRDSRLHLHVPAGATPKDGPSAGCTMITSMLSLAMDKPVRPDLAMTGEVTLTGRVLPIGGVKEKTIAARRSGVSRVIFPFENKRDFDELPTHVKEGLDVHFIKHYSEIYKLAFEYDLEGQGAAESPDSTGKHFELR